jgi:Ca2+-binding RTX toxin-like protein
MVAAAIWKIPAEVVPLIPLFFRAYSTPHRWEGDMFLIKDVSLITGEGHIVGTAGDNIIIGSDAEDRIEGRGGEDIVFARSENDTIDNTTSSSADSNDTVFAGPGDDVVYGANGDSKIFADDGNDILFGARGDDLIHGGDGDDFIVGDDLPYAGNDRLIGGRGQDYLIGQPGDDTLIGGPDADKFIYSYFGTPYENLGHDVVLDFQKGADLVGTFVPFSSLDTNGNGVLDRRDANVTIANNSTLIDFSSFHGNPAGTEVLTVQEESHLTELDFFLS